MTKTYPLRGESDHAFHPGGLLGVEIEYRGMTQRELADLMGRPPQAINEIIKGKKAITADTAVQLEEVLGISARLWLNLQTRYDLIVARQAQQRRVAEGAATYAAPTSRRRR